MLTSPFILHWHINLCGSSTPKSFSFSVLSDRFSIPSVTSTRHAPQRPSWHPKRTPSSSALSMRSSVLFGFTSLDSFVSMFVSFGMIISN